MGVNAFPPSRLLLTDTDNEGRKDDTVFACDENKAIRHIKPVLSSVVLSVRRETLLTD